MTSSDRLKATSPGSAARDDRRWLVALFIGSLLLRLAAIGRPVEVDSAHWVQEGADFARALLTGDLAATFGGAHPGLPSMWLIGASYVMGYLVGWAPASAAPDMITWLQGISRDLMPALPFYVLPRLIQAPVTSALICLFTWTAVRAFGRRAGWMSGLLFALEPLPLAYNRVIVPDALAIDALAVATASAWVWLRGRGGMRWLVLAGVMLGIAAAGKLPAGLLGPVVVLWIAARRDVSWRTRLSAAVLCGVIAVAVLWALFPALWTDPLGTWQAYIDELNVDEIGPRSTYFFGPTSTPGPLFYPVVLIYRGSPALLLGAAIALGMAIARRITAEERPIVWGLATFVVLFTAAISLETGKIDRWLLPVWPAMAILAALGWVRLGELVSTKLSRLRRRTALPGAVLALHIISVLPFAPVFFDYANPLLGGPGAASRALMTGVGEGLDEAALWLAQRPDAAELTGASFYPTCFAPFFPGRTEKWVRKLPNGELSWVRSHFVVFYINQWQRQRDPEQMAYIERLPPVHVVRRHGIEYARIYPGPLARPDDVPWPDARRVKLGEAIRLAGVEHPSEDVVTLYWEVVQPPTDDAVISLRLLDARGQEWGRSAMPPLAGYLNARYWRSGDVMRDVHQVERVNPDAGSPAVAEIAWLEASSMSPLTAHSPDGAGLGTTVRVDLSTGEVLP
ncbi:MAG: hypothetical protein Kow0047_22680 [Anaerolineae bacterium]